MKLPSWRKEKFNDLGFGTKTAAGSFRALNKDGTFNIRKVNQPFFERINFFHSLITMSWWRFFAYVILWYSVINFLFAGLYFFIGIEDLTGIISGTPLENFLEAFFFSAQTITTLGYGRIAPIGLVANIVAATESLLGLLSFALVTGLLYGRFSRPLAKIKYSQHAVIAPYREINGFMFRVVNPHENQLLEVEVQVNISVKQIDSDKRDFYTLELERSKVSFFPAIWTIVHPIDDKSPLHGLGKEEVEEKDIEFFVMIKAFDESFSQTVYSRSSYNTNELLWGEKFEYVVNTENGIAYVDVSGLDKRQKAGLN